MEGSCKVINFKWERFRHNIIYARNRIKLFFMELVYDDNSMYYRKMKKKLRKRCKKHGVLKI